MDATRRPAPQTWGDTDSIFLATKISPPRDSARWISVLAY